MRVVPPFRGRKADGKWVWEFGEKERLRKHLESLADGKWEIPPAKRLTRSQRANNYYWSTVLPLLAAENEQTSDEVHDAMCEMFLPNDFKRVEFFSKLTGAVTAVVVDMRRSSKLTGGEFFDFVERVRAWGLEFLGVVTPDPDPEYWRKRGKRAA